MTRVLCLVVILAACGARIDGSVGLEDDGDDTPDAGPPSADAQPAPDAAPAVAADNACGVAASHGDLGNLLATARVGTQGGTAERIYSLGAPIPATAGQTRPDVVYIELWENYGVFAGGPARTGSFTISGDETSYATCGVCVFTLADVDAMAGPARLLLATSGTVTVHAVAPTTGAPLQVEVQTVTFQEVDAQMFDPVPGSTCPSPLQHGRLDGMIAAP